MKFKYKYFNKFDSLKNEQVQILDDTGKVIHPELMPDISDEELIKAYKLMCLSRMQDFWQNKFQRQGRMLSFLSSTGQEACEVAYGMQLIPGVDWASLAYRNNAAWLASGVPMESIILYWLGNEKGCKMPEEINVLPVNIPIATQYSHAVGIAFAQKFLNKKGLCVTTTGDGGSSEGEFYEAMNFGKLHEVPCLFIVEDNKYAISTPCALSTKATNYAVKAISCGIINIRVDGNDFLASYAVVKEAYEAIRAGLGPHFIEFNTYRLGPHSSSDDPTIYRPKEELEEWQKKDPLVRLKNYLIDKKIWTEEEQAELDKTQKKLVQTTMKKVEADCDVTPEEVFEYTYEEMTPILKEQLAELKSFLATQEEQK